MIILYENLFHIGLHKWFYPFMTISCIGIFLFLENILPYVAVFQNLANVFYVYRIFNMMEEFEGEDCEAKIKQYEHEMCGKCAYSTTHSKAL